MGLTALNNGILKEKSIIFTKAGALVFHTPNWVTRFRVETLFVKEPETIDWIESFDDTSVFYDIGANIGIYSIYAAKLKSCKVLAFEPSAPNQEMLVRNVLANSLSENVVIVPIGLSDTTTIKPMHMDINSFFWGGAHNSLGINLDETGSPLRNSISYQLPAMQLDFVREIFKLPTPDHIKVDVDGLEKWILFGAKNALKTTKSVMVEIDSQNQESLNAIVKIMMVNGLILKAQYLNNVLFERVV